MSQNLIPASASETISEFSLRNSALVTFNAPSSEDLLEGLASRVLRLDSPHQELAAWLQYFVQTDGMYSRSTR
jgi:hypothetical protein